MERLNRKTHYLANTWYQMIHRCYNEKSISYPNYGAKGIEVCERWYDPEFGFDNFVSDMGERPEGHTLDRINPEGDYEPSNCRWADWQTQLRNQDRTKVKAEDIHLIFEMRKKGLLLKEIAKHFDCGIANISMILRGIRGPNASRAT